MLTSAATEVDAATVVNWMTDAVTVLDVRSPAEFETTHIACTYNLPLDLSALPHNRRARADAHQLLDRLPTPEPAAV